ncbi:MAG TPA: hypothetical protein VMI75_19395, partial [Polyangiaceae bacterium]|nr:hypothetical protein [Polyangiaceae bacterium]
TREGALIGTPMYMAPEQLLGKTDIGPATDVYALGLVIFEVACGRLPHEGASLDAKIRARLSSPATPLATARPDLPAAFCHVIDRCLARSPEARYATGRELRAALDDAGLAPRRRWRRVGASATLVLAAVGAFLAYQHFKGSNETSLCHGGNSRHDAVWGPERRNAVRAALVATKLQYAPGAAEAVWRTLDDYTAKLAQQSDDACAATRLRGEQSDDAMDLRMACYDRHWREVDALVDVLRRADTAVVKEAAHAAESLAPIDDCADVTALRAPVPLPRDPAMKAQVETLEQRVASMQASYAVGRTSEAAATGESIIEDARRVAYVPLMARVDLWRGRAYADLSASDKSIPAFAAAFSEALASKDDETLVVAAARLAQEFIYTHETAQFDLWARVAQSALDRGAPNPKIQTFLDHARCVALYNTGRLLDRLTCLEKNAASVELQRPLDDWELTTLGLAAVDAGQYERGLDYVRRGYEYSQKSYGPLHPRTLEMKMYECKAQVDSGDYGSARRTCEAALASMQQEASDNGALIARDRLYTAFALIGDKQYDAGRAALELAQSLGADESGVLDAQAQIDAETGHPDRAIPHFRQALAEVLKDLPAVHPNVVIAEGALGKALLEAHDLAEARRVLDEASDHARTAQLAPTARAEIEFDDARAIWATSPKERERAMDQARSGLATYDANAPHTKGFGEMRAAFAQWLASPH